MPGNQCNPQTGVNLLPVELECSTPPVPVSKPTYNPYSFHTSAIEYYVEFYFGDYGEESSSFEDFAFLVFLLGVSMMLITVALLVAFLAWRNWSRCVHP